MLGEKPSIVLKLNLERGCFFTAVATLLADRRSRSKFDGYLPSVVSSPEPSSGLSCCFDESHGAIGPP